MIFSRTFLLNAGGLFDFDLTFVAETLLFIILALVVTFAFISPISHQLDKRAEDINYDLRKSQLILNEGYKDVLTSLDAITLEISEMSRQLRLTKELTNSSFEEEVASVQSQNLKLLSKLKGDLSIKSAYLFSNVTSELISLTDSFFTKKFKSAS